MVQDQTLKSHGIKMRKPGRTIGSQSAVAGGPLHDRFDDVLNSQRDSWGER